MEHERCEESKRTSTQSSCERTLPCLESMKASDSVAIPTTGVDKKEESGNVILSITPEKPEWRSRGEVISSARQESQLSDNLLRDDAVHETAIVSPEFRSVEDSYLSEYSRQSLSALRRSLSRNAIEIPEKYKILASLFDRMESSIRLLGLRKKSLTFQNISTQVQILTKRKFLCSHLAQMMYVFPEAIQIERILVHDIESLCMKPDMKITLVNVADCPLDPNQCASMSLCQAFRAKLSNFCSTHPEVSNIPEATLPEPFNKNVAVLHTGPQRSLGELPQQPSDNDESLSTACHLPFSFDRQFSHKAIVPEAKKAQLLVTPGSGVTILNIDESKESCKSPQKKDDTCSASAVKLPAQLIYTPNRFKVPDISESTPAKVVLDSEQVIVETPALQTPKRPTVTPEERFIDEDKLSDSETKLSHSARRSLIYSPPRSGYSLPSIVSPSGGQENAGQTYYQATITRSLLGEEITRSPTKQTNRVTSDAAATSGRKMRETGLEKRQEMLALLPNIFDMICLMSRSTKCSVITKQELVHKILSNNLEIEDIDEVEAQLALLEELAPDWISKSSASSGDFIYCIRRESDPESVRARLIGAV